MERIDELQCRIDRLNTQVATLCEISSEMAGALSRRIDGQQAWVERMDEEMSAALESIGWLYGQITIMRGTLTSKPFRKLVRKGGKQ